MKPFVKTILASALLTLATQSFALKTTPNTATTVTPQEQAKIEKIVNNYLLNHPEVVIQAVQNFQRKQYEEAENTVKQTQKNAPTFASSLFNQSTDPVAGNPNGTVSIVEFFDYQCPHCIDMAPVISAIIKANPNVRVVFKEFPIKGPASDLAARAALAANKQGKYYEFSHALLLANKPITEESILEIAKTAGLNVDKLKTDMNDQTIRDQLKGNIQLAKELKLFGTPAFFIGKTTGKDQINYIPGRLDQTQMQSEIDKIEK